MPRRALPAAQTPRHRPVLDPPELRPPGAGSRLADAHEGAAEAKSAELVSRAGKRAAVCRVPGGAPSMPSVCCRLRAKLSRPFSATAMPSNAMPATPLLRGDRGGVGGQARLGNCLVDGAGEHLASREVAQPADVAGIPALNGQAPSSFSSTGTIGPGPDVAMCGVSACCRAADGLCRKHGVCRMVGWLSSRTPPGQMGAAACR